MVFSSTFFIFAFLPITLGGYYLIRKDFRNAFLLLMSLIFYAVGEPKFVFVMMASIVANYLLGLAIWQIKDQSVPFKRVLLVIAIIANLGLLFYYKYYDFAINNINLLFGTNLLLKHIALPIGISFFTFQGMSYVFDVYMGKTAIQKNPLNVALYIALFPQLIAGPIVRYSDINREIVERHESVDDFALGVKRFTIGLAKKIILANSFALLADQAYSTPFEQLGAGLAWLGALAYTLQIYYDFSGYSDMAIGLARMFGFHLLENFNYPYIACSIQDFWRRWHISLSTWFRDYVYIPLGGNRRGNVYLHLFVVFLLTGLWHGASWNFVVWGLWHGAFLIVERLFRGKKSTIQVPRVIKWIYTMLIVIIGWVFFRAPNLLDAVKYLKCMMGLVSVSNNSAFYALQDYWVTFVLGIIFMLPVIRGYQHLRDEYVVINKTAKVIDPVVWAALLIVSIAFTVSSTYNPFIYFNF